MKYLTGIVLFLLIETATAAECRVNGGSWVEFTSWWNNMGVPATVRRIPGTSKTLLDGFRLECRFSPGGGGGTNAKDFWSTYGGYLSKGPKLNGHGVGLNIQGIEYETNIPSGISVATTQKNGPPVDLRIYAYALNTGSINFVAGDALTTIALSQSSNYNNGVPLINFNLYAANNLPPDVSMCTINHNQPIDVNFNQVDPTAIGENPSSTLINKNIDLNYSCSQSGFSMPITIGLRGQAASFDSTVLAMSQPNLGTGLIRNGSIVAPGRSFTTQITNSSGRDTVKFALIRKPGSTPATGAFSGSGTLVMSVP